MEQREFNNMMDNYLQQLLIKSNIHKESAINGELRVRYIQDTFGASHLCLVLEEKR